MYPGTLILRTWNVVGCYVCMISPVLTSSPGCSAWASPTSLSVHHSSPTAAASLISPPPLWYPKAPPCRGVNEDPVNSLPPDPRPLTPLTSWCVPVKFSPQLTEPTGRCIPVSTEQFVRQRGTLYDFGYNICDLYVSTTFYRFISEFIKCLVWLTTLHSYKVQQMWFME